uniref:ZP domain-containing protein n=1 Tax=Branchiostoma floridae TaxID=7739 RepID=C4A0V0_BRAFL|eukprot:XP_002585568.1 hypothetical protein BRAFLDRAFT_111805 [Branchiostoma floridae]
MQKNAFLVHVISPDTIFARIPAAFDRKLCSTFHLVVRLLKFWDERLAFKAQTYSAKCRYRPNPDRSVGGEGFATAGESLYASAVSTDLESVVASWRAEGVQYDFTSNTCADGADCSRYTQLVWATSYKVGCGWTVCPSLDNFAGSDVFFLVCNYGPEGNTGGGRPYVSGTECSPSTFSNVVLRTGSVVSYTFYLSNVVLMTGSVVSYTFYLSNVCTEDGLCIMDAPEDLTITDVTFSSLSVSWVGSTSMVSNYVLTYVRQGGREREVIPAPGPRATSATIGDLFAGTDYVITLKAAGILMESLPITLTQATESVIVNVDCDSTSMGVQIPLAGLPGINSSRVRLSDPQCRGAVDGDNLVVRTDLTDCGTTSQATNGSDVIAFTNELIIDASSGQEVMSWPISCNFLVADWVGFEGEGLLFEIPKPSLQVEDGEHKFNFNMHVFKSEAFASPFRTSDYPISVFPWEPLYFGLFVDTSLPGYVMFAETCFATPTPDPEATPRYSIIEDGCNVDESLTVYDTTPLEFQFSIASTQFQAESMVYVHCRMIVCMEDDSGSRCAQGCIDQNSPIRNRRRRSRDGGEDRRQALMKQGPILIVHEKADDSVVLWSVIACVLGVAYPALCGLAVCFWCARRRRRAKTAADSPGGFGGNINMGFVKN